MYNCKALPIPERSHKERFGPDTTQRKASISNHKATLLLKLEGDLKNASSFNHKATLPLKVKVKEDL